jgi:type IV pilus assembly protein PilC
MRMATATATNIDKARALGAQRAEVSKLTTYDWVALDKRGKRMKGDMPAKNASLVKAELRRQGMNPQSVRERSKPLFGSTGSSVKPGDVAIFSRQIATMMASGVPMVQSFDIIADGQKNVRFKNILLDVKQNIEGGASLHEALGTPAKPLVCWTPCWTPWPPTRNVPRRSRRRSRRRCSTR